MLVEKEYQIYLNEALLWICTFSFSCSWLDWPPSRGPTKTGTLCIEKSLRRIHSSDSYDHCPHWSKQWHIKLLITQPSLERCHVFRMNWWIAIWSMLVAEYCQPIFAELEVTFLEQNVRAHSCDYSLIAFDERVTFWLQRVRSLPCVCVYVALCVRRFAYNHYAIAHAYNAANAHTHKTVTGHFEAKKLTFSSKAIGVQSCVELQSFSDCCTVDLVRV